MTYYLKQINQLAEECYSNKGQLETVIGMRRYIHNNYERELTLDVLSKVRFTSKFHLHRLFKKYYGQTPRQYLIDIRIQEAKKLLKQGTNVTETCVSVGFGSPSSFSTLFRSRIGLSPTEYQKKQF